MFRLLLNMKQHWHHNFLPLYATEYMRGEENVPSHLATSDALSQESTLALFICSGH